MVELSASTVATGKLADVVAGEEVDGVVVFVVATCVVIAAGVVTL